jgi:hypothetical protein
MAVPQGRHFTPKRIALAVLQALHQQQQEALIYKQALARRFVEARLKAKDAPNGV